MSAFESSLLERIASGESHASLTPDASRARQSVVHHLRNMLNTRQGSAAALPDYGLPDFNDVVSRLPDGLSEYRNAIRLTIERFEPRLKRVQVVHVPDADDPLRLKFEISALLALGDRHVRVSLHTAFDDAGQVSVRE
ncbi:MAG TPA: type VI secretion system baseplate subunit TssE [Gammaproteobacteria bacterium]|nr:type VI secretion system baseplate subunit TssE [Gammaproteobacteria bacterium]